ncbi:fibrillin-2-like isoform X6 [Clytia hemisphaerica]|uniref:fibrillin-2-like isoform X6 n=1 Tax=Clytia hemisphaerica TaxID=252671 RepID=UPI0034D3EB5B
MHFNKNSWLFTSAVSTLFIFLSLVSLQGCNGYTLDCTDTHMNIYFEKDVDYKVTNKSLIQYENTAHPDCKAKENATHWTLNTPYMNCSMTVYATDEYIVYNNSVIIDPNTHDGISLVEREEHVVHLHDFFCNFRRSYNVKTDKAFKLDFCGEGSKHNCSQHANCTEFENDYDCLCNRGFTGKGFGENGCLDINECDSDPCSSNANCTNQIGSFFCKCNEGYSGNGFSCNDTNECLKDPCSPNANCTNSIGSFECKCKDGYSGDGFTCDDINECLKDPCSPNANCTNSFGSFECKCKDGFSGDGFTCNDINECLKDPCSPNANCTNSVGSFECKCKDGFSGDGFTCNDINECLKDPCSSNANCTNSIGSFECKCKDGFSGDGFTCNDINECLKDPCSSNANCTNSIGSFECKCKDGFTGDGFTCNDINECLKDPCSPNANCTNSIGSFECKCKDGFSGDGFTCNDINECLKDPCSANATCNNTQGSFECKCNNGFSGDGFVCNDINECLKDPCSPNANCTNSIGSFECKCKDGFSGDGFTCNDINECLKDPCSPNANCTNSFGSFECKCKDGFSGDGFTCNDINECLKDPCSSNANCTNSIGSFECKCKSGFSGDGFTCNDINECLKDPCSPNANCTNSFGSFECKCKNGFSGDGFNCNDINECLKDPCSSNATCNNTQGSFGCTCKDGFTGDGFNCTNINECLSSPCDANATCTDTIGSYTCKCNDGYFGNGTVCNALCSSTGNDCVENATCTVDGSNTVCTCPVGYTGDGKKGGTGCSDINECDNDPCSPNATCANTPGSFVCTCTNGFEGTGLSCSDKNECLTDPCHPDAECKNTFGSYLCKCKTGFTGDGNTNCADINECDTDPCSPNASCNNTKGSFICTCNAGWKGNGTVCTDRDECLDDPCDPNADCTNVVGSYECACKVGYSGDGFTCKDKNECTNGENNCGPNADCRNTDGSFTCICQAGLTGNGIVCEDINECLSDPCHPNATCTNTQRSYNCQCKPGFDGNGTHCDDVDECLNPLMNRCSPQKFCVNTLGAFKCVCDQFYVTQSPFVCVDKDECLDTPCISPAICQNNIGSNYTCSCPNGYNLNPSGNKCDDIDECASPTLNNCNPTLGVCKNIPGSFECSCKSGYQGNGITCLDIDECATGDDNCSPRATCTNIPGSFTCKCNDGFSGDGTSCQDINECLTTCLNTTTSTCTNTEGSYVCACKTGFESTGLDICTNIDECLINNGGCDRNALCTDTFGSFTCECNKGYFGDGFTCQTIIPFDTCPFLENQDAPQQPIALSFNVGFNIHGQNMKTFYACINGILAFDYKSCEHGPTGDLGTPFKNSTMFAPFFSDIDLTYKNGGPKTSQRMYFCAYDEPIISTAPPVVQERIRNLTGVQDFNLKSTLVVTWYQVSPYPAQQYQDRRATFQMVLATDYDFTYLYYKYYDIEWKEVSSLFRVQAGYIFENAATRVTQIINPEISANDGDRLSLHKAVGNKNETGLFFYKLHDPQTPVNTGKCIDWIATQFKPKVYNTTLTDILTDDKKHRKVECPCKLQQAQQASAYKRNRLFEVNIKYRCFYRKRLYKVPTMDDMYIGTNCCYERSSGALILTQVGEDLLTQNHFIKSTLTNKQMKKGKNRKPALIKGISEDTEAFQECCIRSDLCDQYTERRRIPTCKYFKNPARAVTFGDPHLRTLDGFQYTFNGLGEYLYLSETANNLVIHSRTCIIATGGAATVFCGFAVNETDSSLFEVTLNMTTGVTHFLIDNVEQSLNESFEITAPDDLTDITHDKAARTITFSFTSGNGLLIECNLDLLQASLSYEDNDVERNTRGLLGFSNENKDDDLLASNGITLSINSTEQDIYNNFGESWKLSSSESYFKDPQPGQAGFAPRFFTSNLTELFNNNQTLVDIAKTLVDVNNLEANKEFLFDLAVSQSQNLAEEGKTFKDVDDSLVTSLNQFPPLISGPALLDVTYQQSNSFQIDAFSTFTDNLTYSLETIHSKAFKMIDEKTGTFQFTPQFANETVLFNVVDYIGNAGTFNPKILYCYCLNGGTCIDNVQSELVLNVNYKTCLCPGGFTGSNCETNLQPCLDIPCFPDVKCTNNLTDPTAPVAQCDPCPPGFEGDGRKCFDIDDCKTEANDCGQVCVNLLGSFRCECNPGFELETNGKNCSDIDECVRQPDICDADANSVCLNTVGSYSCVCKTGFRRDENNICSDINECAEGTSGCQYQCSNTVGSFTCSCPTGTNLNTTDLKTCIDINECLAKPCDSNADCENVFGSFVCQCKTGFTGNGKQCEDLDECKIPVQIELGITLNCSQICTNNVGSYICSCNPGFTLGTDKHTCVPNPNLCLIDGGNPCDENGECLFDAIKNETSCKCIAGYRNIDSITCEDINECSTTNGGCSQTCTNKPGTYECSCNSGFTLDVDGKTCVDIDECLTNNGGCTPILQLCVNTPGSFRCENRTWNEWTDWGECSLTCGGGVRNRERTCPVGLPKTSCPGEATQTEACKTQRCPTVCEKGEDTCNKNISVCTDSADGLDFNCTCNAGYINSTPKTCVPYCGTSLDTCDVATTTCRNTPGVGRHYECLCKPTLVQVNPDRCDTTCNAGKDSCNKNTSQCFDLTDGGFNCTCKPGYINNTPKTCVPYCGTSLDTCDDATTTCVNTPGVGRHYECPCKAGLTQVNLDRCDTTCNVKQDTCNTTNTVCTDIADSADFNCTCKDGYVKVDAKTCTEYCNKADTCDDVTTTCVNTPGVGRHYECPCKAGLTQVNLDRCDTTCNLELDNCNNVTSICADITGSSDHTCSCKDGYVQDTSKTCVEYCGKVDTCNVNTTNCTSTPGDGRHYVCICKDGFAASTNDSCVIPPTPKPGTGSGADEDTIIIIVVVCVVLLLIILIVVIALRYRRNQGFAPEAGVEEVGGSGFTSKKYDNEGLDD